MYCKNYLIFTNQIINCYLFDVNYRYITNCSFGANHFQVSQRLQEVLKVSADFP